MRYTEVDFLLSPPEPWRDILMVELMELGYEAFEETAHGLKAYVPADQFKAADLAALRLLREPHLAVSHRVSEVPDINWNARWEREFQPIELDGRVLVRAEFHPARANVEHDIIITPRMAFGTGHHATTRMMMRGMLQLPFEGQQVCDLGCGTGVLAILAERLGAAHVLAIDNDPAAVENARRNVAGNRCQRVAVEKGGTDLPPGARYGTILANIERNTLVQAMPAMRAALAPQGRLLLSGYVKADEGVMAEAARGQGLVHVLNMEEGEWMMSEWEKQEPVRGA